MSTTIEDRLILLLREEGEPHGFWQSLEGRTGISAQRWRKAYARRQRPTSDMISALGRLFPHYAFWLMTGITDAKNGHTAPSTALTFPELPRQHVHSHWANAYFQASLELNEQLYLDANVNLQDDQARLKAAERVMVGSQWWGSNLVDPAYRIAASEKYSQLQSVLEERERHRESHLSVPKQASPHADPLLVPDPRTGHQGIRDLLWRPKETFSKNGTQEN